MRQSRAAFVDRLLQEIQLTSGQWVAQRPVLATALIGPLKPSGWSQSAAVDKSSEVGSAAGAVARRHTLNSRFLSHRDHSNLSEHLSLVVGLEVLPISRRGKRLEPNALTEGLKWNRPPQSVVQVARGCAN